ncbi:hypothetical protein H4219_002668 [Mycoemilia scoparia]|uniref:Uncharacterized protein n=1 Tax=Mycoemilia scoparia TaxID=417184 RepID=A0A9W8DU32_9FUNG|nr:hypothetical protein H4219_002668 [Mycoemilia scoparia]
MASMEWYEMVLNYKYNTWKYHYDPSGYYKLGHKYTSYIHIRKEGDIPGDKFFDLRCPKLTKLQVENDHEFIRKLSRFTKLNPTITELSIEEDVYELDNPVVELPILIDIVSPLYERLTLLELDTTIHLPSLSFLLEKLPSLGSLMIQCCSFNSVLDIFVPSGGSQRQLLETSSKSSVEPKDNRKLFYNLTNLTLSKWFVPKSQYKGIINDFLVFDSGLFPSLKIWNLLTLFEDFPYPIVPGLDLESIPHIYFFNSVVHRSISDLRFYTGSQKLLSCIAKSCPNLKSFDLVTLRNTDDDKMNVIKTFRSIAELFPKLEKLSIGMWEAKKDNEFLVTNHTVFYSETLDYTLEQSNVREISYTFNQMDLDNGNSQTIEQDQLEQTTSNNNDLTFVGPILPRIQTPLSFSCMNTLKKLNIHPLGDLTPHVLFPIAQFTNLENLDITMSTLDDIELQTSRIESYYTLNHKPFGKLIYFNLVSSTIEPDVEQFKLLIELFPVLKVFSHYRNDEDEDNEGEFLALLGDIFSDIVFVS